ncbi:MAG: lipid-binding SYLF domain-containing protein [Opitutaceae bacterium]|nr:lipid-binding SYLF domain-containing protein [Opitutaceae bacterium]
MKYFLTLTLAALFGALVARAEPTRAELVTRIESCEAVLQELQAKPAKEAWQRAKAVLILNQFRAGFLIGVKDGYGVIMVKKADGRWSLPVLVNAGEASLGLQLGASAVESVFIITDDQVPRRLFTNRFNVGVDAKAVAGPHASQSEATNVEILRTPLLAYTKSTGLFAGATVKAGHISRNDSANFTLYDTRYTLPELLYSDWVSPPKEVQPLMALMQKLAP